MTEILNRFQEHISILHIEDDEAYALLVELTLTEEYKNMKLVRVQAEKDLCHQLVTFDPDIILSDYSMPGFSGREALKICQALKPDIPFIFISGTIGEERAVEALKNGAADYVLKDHMGRLPHAVAQAIAMQHERRAKKKAEENLHAALEHMEFLVQERTRNLETAKSELEEKNREMTDSINYAKHIQNAFTRELRSDVIGVKDLFVLDMPRDILSGDFHWGHFDETNNCSYVALGDCTGHGVPGALMTILAVQLLEQQLMEQKRRRDTKKVIMALDAEITDFLGQTEDSSMLNDGMEMVLFRIDHDSKIIHFTNIGRDVYHYSKGVMMVTKGYRSMIGGIIRVQTQHAEVHSVHYGQGDRVYAFSDGYVDQFGGERGGKMLRKRKEAFLNTIQSEPFAMHRQLLQRHFLEWKGSNFQVDDMIALGLEL
ncbi:MAG: response regulator [Flavobacteriales bacterium]|nr:response regulator [Flavobacteriales bacterium]